MAEITVEITSEITAEIYLWKVRGLTPNLQLKEWVVTTEKQAGDLMRHLDYAILSIVYFEVKIKGKDNE